MEPGLWLKGRVYLGVGGVLGPRTHWSCLPQPHSPAESQRCSGTSSLEQQAPTHGASSIPGTASLQSDYLICPFAEGLLLLS